MPAPKATTEQLKRDLYELKLSPQEIIEKYGYRDFASLWRAFKYRGIPWPHYKLGALELTPLQRELICGTLMGDGYIPLKNGRHTFLRMSQCAAQLEYLEWKVQLLEGWITPRGIATEIDHRNHTQVTAATYTHPAFTELRRMFYPNGKKIVSETILNLLTPFSLAVWFMDDGSCVNHNARKLRLHTGGFTMPENVLMHDWFRNTHGIDSTIPTCAGYPILCFYADNAERLASLLSPYIIPSMRYKLGC